MQNAKCSMQNDFDLFGVYHREIPSLLMELAGTRALLRLGQVGMNCGCEYTGFPLFAPGKSYSRLEHSLGVGLIVWHFTGDPAQAAAGLLHDIATPTFAHVVDFLRGDYLTQEATEDGTRERISGSPESIRSRFCIRLTRLKLRNALTRFTRPSLPIFNILYFS